MANLRFADHPPGIASSVQRAAQGLQFVPHDDCRSGCKQIRAVLRDAHRISGPKLESVLSCYFPIQSLGCVPCCAPVRSLLRIRSV
jgi:hypothetical protein